MAEVGPRDVVVGLRFRQREGQHAQVDGQFGEGLPVGQQLDLPRVEAGGGIPGHVEGQAVGLVAPGLGQVERLEGRRVAEGHGGVVHEDLVVVVAADIHVPVAPREVHQQLVGGADLVDPQDAVVVDQQVGHQHALALVGMVGHPGAAAAEPALDELGVDGRRGHHAGAVAQVADAQREGLDRAEGDHDQQRRLELPLRRVDVEGAGEAAATGQVVGLQQILRRGGQDVARDGCIGQGGLLVAEPRRKRFGVVQIIHERPDLRRGRAPGLLLQGVGAAVQGAGPGLEGGIARGGGDGGGALPQRRVAGLRRVGDRQRLRLERGVVDLQVADRPLEAAAQAGRPEGRRGQHELVVLHLPAAVEVEGVAPPVGGVVEFDVVPLAPFHPRLAPHDQFVGHDLGGGGGQRQFEPTILVGAAIEESKGGGRAAGGHAVEADPEGAGELAPVDPLEPLPVRGLVGDGLGRLRSVEDQRAPVEPRLGARLQHQAAAGPVRNALLRTRPEVEIEPGHGLGGRAFPCRERGQRARANPLQ